MKEMAPHLALFLQPDLLKAPRREIHVRCPALREQVVQGSQLVDAWLLVRRRKGAHLRSVHVEGLSDELGRGFL